MKGARMRRNAFAPGVLQRGEEVEARGDGADEGQEEEGVACFKVFGEHE